MAELPPDDRRKFDRAKLRVPCDVKIDGKEHKGFALDLSARGLFVQTTATARAGTEVRVRLRDPEHEPIELITKVARIRSSHRAVTVVQAGGLGLEVQSAPEGYFRMVLEMT